MTTDQIRECFLDFFQSKGHARVPSDSLIPQNDPTLLFTGAGMNQFKENFLGIKKEPKRAASCQKCLRTADLDEVGRTAYHHSFFEMLGNFSFGDYFKKEAIVWAWEFLTKVLGIPADRLRVSVHKGDQESSRIWKEEIGVRRDWIYSLGDESNFWPANAPKNGPNGPCGPCSEIYYDQNPAKGSGGSVVESGERFAEIWNLVFTQFDRQEGGVLVPLSQKNIDTGMGLERLACVLQGKKSNYEIDIFEKITAAVAKSLSHATGKLEKTIAPSLPHLYAISDHVRAAVFAIADGVIPGNEGRGYVIRKLIRRALWRARQITPTEPCGEPFLYSVVPTVIEVMGTAYPDLKEAQASILSTLKGEEERFLATIETGLEILGQYVDKLENKKTKLLPGEVVFELYDTYGFPDELTRIIAKERGFEIDQTGFDQLMEGQRKRAKSATKIASGIFVASDLEKRIAHLPPTKFLGYSSLEARAEILFSDIQSGKGIVVLDQTPFYGESGGQVGDQGILQSPQARARVIDTQKKDQLHLHFVELESGKLSTGDAVKAEVDRKRRESAMRNHTATHLLHAALRQILGAQARQLGSLVAPDRLRFDFSYSQALSPGQIQRIEDIVNEQILNDFPVSKEEKTRELAKKEGAIAFFGEKYGEKVRVVSVADFSKELCGGTHCERTGQIGSFVIVSESSIGSGIRRIEALTGEGAFLYLRNLRARIQDLSQILKTTPEKILERVTKLQENIKRLEKLQGKAPSLAEPASPSSSGKWIELDGGFKVYQNAYQELTVDLLRKHSDELRAGTLKTVYFLASENPDKIYFVLGLSHDLVKTNIKLLDLGRSLASLLGGSSGGRADLIQGGAVNQGQLGRTLEPITQEISAFLRQRIVNECKS